jgi:hypothetical protein
MMLTSLIAPGSSYSGHPATGRRGAVLAQAVHMCRCTRATNGLWSLME